MKYRNTMAAHNGPIIAKLTLDANRNSPESLGLKAKVRQERPIAKSSRTASSSFLHNGILESPICSGGGPVAQARVAPRRPPIRTAW